MTAQHAPSLPRLGIPISSPRTPPIPTPALPQPPPLPAGKYLLKEYVLSVAGHTVCCCSFCPAQLPHGAGAPLLYKRAAVQ